MGGSLIYWLLFGILALGAGGGVGFGIASLQYAKMLAAHEANAAISQGMLNDLERITAKIKADIGEHSAKVKQIDRRLSSSSSGAGSLQGIQQATGDLSAANDRLQAGLSGATEELNEQSQKLVEREQKARTDGLTLLMNRRCFDEALQTLVKTVDNGSRSGGLLMLDIDHFQQFNEQHGQQVGDKLLKHVARTLRETLLGSDAIAARYGGEEFAIILPAAKISHEQRFAMAKQLAGQLRAAVEATMLVHEGQSLSARVSIGLAAAAPGLATEQLIGRVDESLAAAKQAGRNRCFYHSGKSCLPVDETPQSGVAAERTPKLSPTIAVAPVKPSSGVTAGGNSVNKTPAEATPSPTSQPAASSKERRKHERISCNGIHLIAPCPDGFVPAKDKFFRVQFCDISSGGFAMILPGPPTTDQFAVALKKATGLIFMGAQIISSRQSDEVMASGEPMAIVSCKFTQRLFLPSESHAVSPQASA